MTAEGITYIEVDLQTSQHITLYNSVFTYITVYLHIVIGNDHCHIDQMRDTKAYVELLPPRPGLRFFCK